MNLLTDRPTQTEIRPLLNSPGAPPWLWSFDDPAWEELVERPEWARAREYAREESLKGADVPLPELTDELYRRFHITGERVVFERPYFERRRLLGESAFALLACAEADLPELTRCFLTRLRAVFFEESWALAAHVADPSGRDPMVIDLFGAETAHAMAEMVAVFGRIIPEELQQEIRTRLRTTIFENYRDHAESLPWTSMTNNWNSVCHQGVLSAALILEDDLDLVASMLALSARYLPLFLEGFGADGGCNEGPSYWSYGFGFFAALNEVLEWRTSGRLSLFEGSALVPSIARYGPTISLSGGHVVNFSDGSDRPLAPWLLQYLGVRLGETSCLRLAAANAALLRARASTWSEPPPSQKDFTSWVRTLRHCPEPESGAVAVPLEDSYLPDLAVWVVRGRDASGHLWEVAAKAGHNEEHHNHNDVGNFVLNVDSVPLITEIGAPVYVKAFFKRELRYRFLAARSLGHSVPLVNGQEQVVGEEYLGRMLRADLQTDPASFQVDFAAAYPEGSGCSRLVRTITLAKTDGELVVEDEFGLAPALAVESAFITHAEDIAILGPELARIREGGVTLELRAESPAVWDRVERHPYQDHSDHPRFVHRLVLGTEALSGEIRLKVRLRVGKTAGS